MQDKDKPKQGLSEEGFASAVIKPDAATSDIEIGYRNIIEHLPQRIFLKDRNMVYFSCNKKYAHDLGIRPEEIMGKTDYDFYPKELADNYRADDNRIMESGKQEEKEETHLQGGKERIAHTVKAPLRDERGDVIGIVSIFDDITDQKQAERQLRQRTHDLGERVKELNCLYSISGLTEKSGTSLEEILRGTVDLIPSSWQYPEITCARIILGDRSFQTKNFKEAIWKQDSEIRLHEEHIGSVEVYYLEERAKNHEGPFLKEERNLINAIAERIERIIEHQEAMNMLQTERDKFQGFLNALGEGVYIVSPEYVIEYQNQILEDIHPDSKGKKCYRAYRTLEAPCEHCLMNEVIRSGRVRQNEAIFSDGGNYDIIFSPFVDVDGDSKVIVLLRDITEKRVLEAEALRAGHLASLGELAAGVAHEINNPINGIINYAQMLKDCLDEQLSCAELPARIIKEGERIAQIVQNLLSFAREQDEEHGPALIGDILSESLRLVGNQIMKDGITLTLDIPSDLPRIMANKQEMQQVFLNILSNARYALSQRYPRAHQDKLIEIKGGTVEIEGRKHVQITFHDHGTGIPAEIRNSICNPFFSTKPRGEGTGLGLSISHGIVNKHGGKLWFKSSEGEYTDVIVEVPVIEDRETVDDPN